MTKGNPWLRGMLGEVVWAIFHTRDNYLVEQYRRIGVGAASIKRLWQWRIQCW